MSDEDFLSRWSRRKRAAEKPVVSPPRTAPASQTTPALDGKKDGVPSLPKADETPEDDFDLSTLPSLESITAATDVTAFLRKGVPLELSRAALRRAWTADPAIRDFVGLAENAWDFNDPNAIPGFGPLDYSQEQIGELVGRIMGDIRETAEDLASQEPSQATPEIDNRSTALAPEPQPPPVPAGEPIGGATEPAVEPSARQPDDVDIAVQKSDLETDENVPVVRHAHGSALPR
jgi:hypothetical protein